MKLGVLLKWGLYRRIKRRITNLKWFRFVSAKVVIFIFLFVQLLKFISFFLLSYIILTSDSKNHSFNVYIDGLFNKITQYQSVIYLLFITYILLTIYLTSVNAIRYSQNSDASKWIYSLKKIPIYILDIQSYLEEIIWELRNIVTVHVPIISCYLLIVLNMNITQVVFINFVYILVFILMTLSFCLIYRSYFDIFSKLYLIRLSINILYRASVVMLSYLIGKDLSVWFQQFPLVKSNVTGKQFTEWIDDFDSLYIKSLTTSIHNFINNILNEPTLPILFILGILGVFILFLTINIRFFNKTLDNSTLNNRFKLKLPKVNLLYGVTFLRSRYFYRYFPESLGSAFFWGYLGINIGLLQGSPSNKMFFLILIGYAVYSAFYVSEELYNNLIGFYALDSENKKITLWFNGNVSKLFKKKKLIFLLNTTLIMLLGNFILFLTTNLSFIFYFMITGIQMILSGCFFSLFTIPSIMAPHFQYSNVEELNQYEERKKISGMINFLLVFIMIPLTTVPTALYITSSITNIYLFYLTQFMIVPIIIYMCSILITKYIDNTLHKQSFFHKILE